MNRPLCKDSRECFAKIKTVNGMRCTILSDTPPDGSCTFCKRIRDYTDGKRYPFNRDYAMRGR